MHVVAAVIAFTAMGAEPTEDAPTSTTPTDARSLTRLARWLPLAMAGHLIVGFPALLISLVVAYGTYVQAGATQRMQQAATWPFIGYQTTNYTAAGEHIISLLLTNNGLGPALLGPIEIRYRGRAVATPVDLLAACCGYRKGQSMQLRTMPVAHVALRPGEEVAFMSLPDVPTNAGLIQRFDAAREQVRVRLCYCSIFDDCWTVEGAQAAPKPVKSCPTDWKVLRTR